MNADDHSARELALQEEADNLRRALEEERTEDELWRLTVVAETEAIFERLRAELAELAAALSEPLDPCGDYCEAHRAASGGWDGCKECRADAYCVQCPMCVGCHEEPT